MSLIGIGTDLIELSRIRAALERHGARFLRRCYTAAEIDYCHRHADPVPELAARFAAKEAAAKALGTGIAQGVHWRQIEVLRQPGCPPTLHLHDTARRRADRLGVGCTHVTLTHARELASAVVVFD